jgi:hypothetical protein
MPQDLLTRQLHKLMVFYKGTAHIQCEPRVTQLLLDLTNSEVQKTA